MNNLAIIEYQGSRVLTTAQLAEVYECEAKNITDNYGNNSSRFMEGKDFHMLQGNDLRIFKGSLPEIIGEPLKFAPKLILWTSRGANRHCKMLGTDKAWDQFDVLEETYFNVKSNAPVLPQTYKEALVALLSSVEDNERLTATNAILVPKAAFYDVVADSKDAVAMGDVAKVIAMKGMGRNNLFAFLRGKGILDANNIPYQTYQDRGYFRVIEQIYSGNDGEVHVKFKTLVFQKGIDYISKLLKEAV